MNDFCKFACFVRGVLESGTVIEYSGRQLRNEVKMHFKSLMHHCREFEKYLKRSLGEEIAEAEDDINSSIIHMVWQIYEMDPDTREKFLEHINQFDDGN
jgi:hypothetical protein